MVEFNDRPTVVTLEDGTRWGPAEIEVLRSNYQECVAARPFTSTNDGDSGPALVTLEDGSMLDAAAVDELRTANASLQKQANDSHDLAARRSTELMQFKARVRDVFKELVDNQDLGRSEVNEYMTSLDLEKFAVEYRYDMTVRVSGTVTTAADEDDIAGIIDMAAEVDVDLTSVDIEDWTVDHTSAEVNDVEEV